MQFEGGGSSFYARRALWLDEPPSIDAGEITGKGCLKQRVVLQRRAALADLLHAAIPAAAVIVL